MKTSRVCQMVLAGMLALAVGSPRVLAAAPAKAPVKKPVAATAKKTSAPAKAPVKKPAAATPKKTSATAKATKPAPPATGTADPKQVEAQLLAAQAQVVAGNLDAGLEALSNVLAKAAPASAPRVAFLQKLVEVRVADRLGDQAKVLAGLAAAMKEATQPDQVAAVWQLGLGLAQAAVAAKSPAASGLVEFLSKGAAPAMRQFGPHLDVARLYLAQGNAPAAEAALTSAARRIGSPAERTAWTSAVAELAKRVDGGQVPQAGADLFERLRKAATPAVQAALDVAEGRALLARAEWVACEGVLDRAVTAAKGVKEQAVPVLALGYDLAAGLSKAGKPVEAAAVLAKAEAMAQALPASAEATTARCKGLVSAGQAESASEIAWKAALGAKSPAERGAMLSLYVQAAVASGQGVAVVPKLKSMNAPASLYAAAAGALAKAGKAQEALAVVEAAPPAAVAEDAKAAAEVASVMRQVHQQQKQTAARQAARCRAVAAEYAAAAKKAEAAKDAAKAAAHAKQAAVFETLATEIEK